MSRVAPRQNLLTGVTFIEGMIRIMRQAVILAPGSFNTDERRLMHDIIEGLEYMIGIVDIWFTSYRVAYREETIVAVNNMYTSIIKDRPEDSVMALLVKCYETLNANCRAHVDLATDMPSVLVDLVVAYTSMQQHLPNREYLQIFCDLWTYITGSPGVVDDASHPSNVEMVPETAHRISDIDWIPRPAYGVAVGLMLKKAFNFDGRFYYLGTWYNVDRVKLADEYTSGAKVVNSRVIKDGLTSLLYTFKRPDWNPSYDEVMGMRLAVLDTNIITPLVRGGTQHSIVLNTTGIYNFLPFRQDFDLCDQNGNSIWRLMEGDGQVLAGEVFKISIVGGASFYPTDSIRLGPGDIARVTYVNLDDGITLTNITRDGKSVPDILFTQNPIF